MKTFYNNIFNFDNIFKSNNKLSYGLLPDTKSQAKATTNTEKKELEKLDLNSIIQVDFPDNQYFREQTNKTQIVLHHTVSGQGVDGDISWWRSTVERIGTAMIIGRDGKIYQCFSSLYWGHHLGIKSEFLKAKGFSDYATRNTLLNKQSIGIEIDSWGWLIKDGNFWYPAKWDENKKKYVAYTKVMPIKDIVEYNQGFMGYNVYEKYTDAQIESLRKLLVFWCDKFKIPKTYNEDMWDVSMKALSGESHIWSHSSFRSDKSDVSPQPNLIAMLKSL